MDDISRLANIQRTLLESGAEAAADGENGSREEEVNLKMSRYEKIFRSNCAAGERGEKAGCSNNLTILDRRAAEARRQEEQVGGERLKSDTF